MSHGGNRRDARAERPKTFIYNSPFFIFKIHTLSPFFFYTLALFLSPFIRVRGELVFRGGARQETKLSQNYFLSVEESDRRERLKARIYSIYKKM